MTTKPAKRISAILTSMPWAMTEDALRLMLAIADRVQHDPAAVEARKAERLAQTASAGMRDGVAVLPVIGPIARRMNMFSEVSGGTSLDLLARDFNSALDNGAVKAIALNIDSPGGEANGVSEFANMIYAARGRKPIYAYVGGMGASAAYWIASAADKIIVDDTAMLGSIGVITTMPTSAEEDEVTFVSSQSPDKRPDPTTPAGAESIQTMIDNLAQVFIESVARNRGVSASTVLSDFGHGGLFVGRDAVQAGLADRVGSFEGVMAELAQTRVGASVVRANATAASLPAYAPSTIAISASAGGFVAGPLDPLALPALPQAQPEHRDPITTQGAIPMSEPLEQATTFANPSMPVAADPAVQAQMEAYIRQMEARSAAAQESAFAQMRAEFDRRAREMEQRGQIEQFARAKTVTTTDQPWAVPCTADELTQLLLETPSGPRQKWQTLLNRVTASGLLTFDEIGSSGAGGEQIDQWNAIVSAKVAAGMSKVDAIKQTAKEHPGLYAAQQLPAKKGGR